MDVNVEDWKGRIAMGHDVRVTFKHEDRERGEDIGPVWISDITESENDPNLKPIASVNGAMVCSHPYAYVPDWEVELPWMSIKAARKIALSVGVQLGVW